MNLEGLDVQLDSRRYWRLSYRDAQGNRRWRYFGSAERKSQRSARTEAKRFLARLHLDPAASNGTKAPRLGEHIERYLRNRLDAAASTRLEDDRAGRLLISFFGASRRIDQITPAACSDFRTALATGKLKAAMNYKINRRFDLESRLPAEASVAKYIRHAKAIFGQAVRERTLSFNPFGHVSGVAPTPRQNWHHVTREELQRLLDASPSVGWKLFLSLQRLCGLRRGEAFDLRWSDVDLNNFEIEVYCTKTSRTSGVPTRIVPILDDALKNLVVEARQAAAADDELVVSKNHVGRCMPEKRFDRICKRAGVQPWNPRFQVLRRSCETDWARMGIPEAAYIKAIGHSKEVSRRFYVQVLRDHYERANSKV